MSPVEAAELRLQTAATVADERDRATVKGSDVRLVLAELARLRETLIDLAPRD